MPPLRPVRLALLVLGLAPVAAWATGQEPGPPADQALALSSSPMPALDAALGDIARDLQAAREPAYHVALAITETRQVSIQGTHGALGAVDRSHDRIGDVDLRVGTMELDNTHKLRDAGWFSEPQRPMIAVPLTDEVAVLRNRFLRAADDVYRSARQQLIKVRANQAVKVEREDLSADFSPAPVVTYTNTPPLLEFDEAAWTAVVREASAELLAFPSVYDSAVQIVATDQRSWLADSAGTRIADGRHHYRIAAWGSTVADDGMNLTVYDYVDVSDPEHLPDTAAIHALARGVGERLTALRAAPPIDPYAGPAILRGRAAGVFFHEIFGHRIEGHRQKDEDEGQTFTSRVGQPILPGFLSVVDDPTLGRLAGQDLNGFYHYDDEGVAAQRVPLVDHGILRNFLLSRSPIEGFPTSNGHGRRQPGSAAVARQGNLIVEAATTVPYATLRKMLVDQVKAQGKPYGLIFDDISGGFTFTGRSEPNAFVVNPVTVWKVFPDGRPDELVRGVDLIGTPLTTFSRILAAGDDPDVFNGVCGAESGWVPVSAVAPSLLVQEVEVQRHEKANDRPPLLPAPGTKGGGDA